MKRVGMVLRLVAVLVLGLVLNGCAFSSIPQFGDNIAQLKKTERSRALNQIVPNFPQQNNLTALAYVGRVSPGQSFSGYLTGQEYSDYDLYHLEGVTAGTSITVTLSGPYWADFDLWIWKDGNWETNWNWTSNEQMETSAGTNTWIFVGVWSGSGNYTLKVIAEYLIPIPSYLQSYIERIEFDLPSVPSPGVRLYVKKIGIAITLNILAPPIADFILSRPEWKQANSDRPRQSVIDEIIWHWGIVLLREAGVIHIEYYCADLRSYERPIYGCQKY